MLVEFRSFSLCQFHCKMYAKIFIGLITVQLLFLEVYSCRRDQVILLFRRCLRQKQLLHEFRLEVEDYLPHQYMKEDAFLLRYLAARNFNLKAAVVYLLDNLEWRDREDVDSILERNWSDYEERFPYEITTSTKDGRPVLYLPSSKWDIYEEVNGPNFYKLVKYVGVKAMEDATRRGRLLERDSNDIVQYDIIINMANFANGTRGCFQCIRFYTKAAREAETKYPMAVQNVFLINAPASLQQGFSIVYMAFSEAARQSVRVLGGKESYEPVLLQYMEKKQFPKDLQ